MPPRPKLDLSTYSVTTFSREEFLHDVWNYGPGEHVTVLGPSGSGKTHLAYELLGRTATPELQAVVIVMKPRDETVTRFSKANNFRIVRDWPPSKVRATFEKKPSGFTLWPIQRGDPDYEDYRHAVIFQRAIRDNYDTGNRITFADEVYSLENEYSFPTRGVDMRKNLVRVWSKGRSMENGLWAASQRPAYISRYAYQAHHLFLANDPDADVQKRYGEIGGGIDPQLVQTLTSRLTRFQFVYILRDTRQLCIVDR